MFEGVVTWNVNTNTWTSTCARCSFGMFSVSGMDECIAMACPEGSAGSVDNFFFLNTNEVHEFILLFRQSDGQIVLAELVIMERFRGFLLMDVILDTVRLVLQGPALIDEEDALLVHVAAGVFLKNESCSAGGTCFPVTCPKGSVRTEDGDCVCSAGFAGSLSWRAGEWEGECDRCPRGYWAKDGSNCLKVDCPSMSSGHPKCKCLPGYIPDGVEPVWNQLTGVYMGGCKRCDKVSVSCPM